MEVLPCAGVADRAKQNSETAFVSNGESGGIGHENQVQKVELPVANVEEPQTTRNDAFNGTLLPDCQVESQRLSEDGNDLEDDDLSIQNDFSEAPDNHHETVDTIESEPSNNRDSESSLSVPKWLQHDESVAVWVKWRGKWQAGIRCARADWPLSTLRAKPTHDRKKYFVIFFPRTKNYSWADMLLVRSIHEFPQPNACRTHKIGLKMVRDLDVARRFIMKKLLVGILSIVDQFHREALVDTARDIMAWKEFAMEAVRFNEYSDLGRMLLKLQNMIIAGYINPEWLQQSYDSWAQRCQDAQSAEAIELLKEELSDSILWTKVNSLANGQPHPPLGSEWPSWKHDVTKWFSTSDTVSGISDVDRKRPESPSDTTLPVSTKRPKLEIRRPEPQTSTSLQPMAIETENSAIPKPDEVRWDGIVVEAGNGNSGFVQTEDVEKTPDVPYNKAIYPGSSISRSRQCIAFIESKGRQCVRWANDGDVYCCVHLTSRFTGSTSIKHEPSPPVNTPMCGGTTVLGNQCKHRSLPGSSFCKKHGPRNNLSNTSIPKLETSSCRDLVLVGQTEVPICIGSIDSSFPCNEAPSRYSMYCDKHIPSWLKRARNGKSRIILKEMFTGLLKDCVSPSQKLCLHKACELFYKFFKSIMSLRNPVPTEVQLQWALSEASKDPSVGEILLKLVSTEKSRLSKIWGFTDGEKSQFSSVNSEPGALPLAIESTVGDEKLVQCKFCLKEFRDDKELGIHCVENHKKEAQWLFRGHACAICLDSFTNRKLLEAHLQERHRVEFVEQCILLQCIHCKSHFGNPDELWRHVLSVHNAEFKMSKTEQLKSNSPIAETNSESVRKFVCKFCGLKFDLLPDLGRHHQAAHMGAPMLGPRPAKKGIRFYSYRLKSGRLTRPGFKKGPGLAAYKIRNRGNPNLKKRIQAVKSLGIGGSGTKPEIPDPEALSRLAESQCLSVANMLFSEVQKTKPRPNNVDILAAARVACCKASLKPLLEGKYGELPEKLYLKAAKLCSENGIRVEWHQNGFVCPRGCKSLENPGLLSSVTPRENRSFVRQMANASENTNNWEVDECHYVIDLPDFREIPKGKVNVLCKDISFGKESIPIACVVDEYVFDGQVSGFSELWESFIYVTRPMLDGSHDLDIESLQLGCACSGSLCLPERCDHVYLFDNDFEDAIDVYGKPMHGRFPYDDNGRLILEEGYLVYECNRMCRCDNTCPNRVLQNGLRVKLEVFKTENKGWGVRTYEPILRGTFVCEYIGEVLDEQEGNERRISYGEQGCSYMYRIDAHTNDMSRLIEGQENYVIDATKYGNVSRFINHSCVPNLVNHQILVDSMESRYAHIGLYASRDILSGEELTHNYRYNLMPGDGFPCHCGTSKCRGRLC